MESFLNWVFNVFSTASSKFLGGMAIPRSWVWPMVWLHWCGNSSPQFLFLSKRPRPFKWWRVQCRCSLYPWFWWRWPPKPNSAHCVNSQQQRHANRCHVLMFKSHVACVWWRFTGWWTAGQRSPNIVGTVTFFYSGVLPCCDFTKYFSAMQTRIWKLKKTAQT